MQQAHIQFSQNGVYLHKSTKELYYIKFLNNGVHYWGLDPNLMGLASGFVADFKISMNSNNYNQKTVDDLTKEQKSFLFKLLLEDEN